MSVQPGALSEVAFTPVFISPISIGKLEEDKRTYTHIGKGSVVSGGFFGQPDNDLYILTVAHLFNGSPEDEYGLFQGNRQWAHFKCVTERGQSPDRIWIQIGKVTEQGLLFYQSEGLSLN